MFVEELGSVSIVLLTVCVSYNTCVGLPGTCVCAVGISNYKYTYNVGGYPQLGRW